MQVNPAYPKPLIAWSMIVILMIAAIVSFIDRQVVAIVVEPMKADLGIGDSQIGWLYGVFAVFYAIAALPIAWLADHKPRKYIISIGILFWSIMTMICGLSRTFWQVLAARIGVGVGEASLTPATTSIVSDLFPRDQVPMALSIFQTGAVMGSGIAFVIGGYVLSIVEQAEPLVLPGFGALQPWQQTFIYLGLPGLVLSVVFLLVREPTRRALPQLNIESGSSSTLLEFYRRNTRALTLHHLGFLCLSLMGYAFVFWTVSYFVRIHGLDAATASQRFGWIFFLAGPLGPVAFAYVARLLSQRGHQDANITAGMLAGLCAVPSILAIQFVPNATWAFVLYVPAMMFINAPFGVAYGALPVITPPQLRAQVAAVYMLVVSIGMMLGPPIAGFFNEVIFPGTAGVRYSLITVTSVFGALGFALLWFARKPYAVCLKRADTWVET